MSEMRAGGEVDTMCNRCKLTLAHTILAMVGSKIARVRCNTCNGEHAFHGGTRTPTASKPRQPKAAKVIIGFEQRLQQKGLGSVRRYSPRETFAMDDLIDHPTFGMGIVEEVRGDKVDVAFKADRKTLVHARGVPAAASTEAESQ